MKKIISLGIVLSLLFSNFAYVIQVQSASPVSAGQKVDILKDGITATNAGMILSMEKFTSGKMELSGKKFAILPGVQVSLDPMIGTSFALSNTTRDKFSQAKVNSKFQAKAVYEDTIIEYPDRVRLTTKTEYSYNNKSEYDMIFSGISETESIDSTKVKQFLSTHKEYNKYADGIKKADKKTIIVELTDRLYKDCTAKKRTGASCNKDEIARTVTNEIDGYKGTRVITEIVDVNKIPLVYSLDTKKDFVDRLKASNISKEPSEVRVSKQDLKKAFDQYAALNISNSGFKKPTTSMQSPKAKSCDGLSGSYLVECETELRLLNANIANNNPPTVYTAELLNGFTLGESYSYTLSDSYSVLGFTVYDIGVSFYAGYGVGIRIPIDVSVTLDKNRLEKGIAVGYTATVSVDTKDKNKEWFSKALGSNKAFDGKEAVLEAGAYAKGWVELFEKTVFSGQIGGKKDWGSNQTIPFGNTETPIFSGEVKGEQIGLELVLYGIHISGDLKAEGKIRGDITYECRTLSSTGTSVEAKKCKNLELSQLSDSEVEDIMIDPITKKSTLSLKAESDKFFYKNNLGIYQPYGVSLERFKYKPDLIINLFLRGKVGVNTGDYFGWYWMKTPWLKVYSFSLDLPTLMAHEEYKTKTVASYEKNYLYNFNKSAQDIVPGDTSVKYPQYQITSSQTRRIETKSLRQYTMENNDSLPDAALYNFGYGGKVFYKNTNTLVAQKNNSCNDSDGFQKCYQIVTLTPKSSDPIKTKQTYYGYTRTLDFDPTKNPRPFYQDDLDNKVSEMQYANSSKVYYYSEATNSLWSGNISGNGSTTSLNLPKISGDKKYLTLKSDVLSPKKESFSDVGDVSQNMIPPTFQKFQFAFHPDFSENTSKSENTLAYLSKDHSVQVYRKGKWFPLELGVLEGNIVSLQLSKNKIQPKESDMTVITKNGDRYYIYTYEYQDPNHLFVRNSLYSQKSFPAKNYTAFSYDIVNKILYAALEYKNTNTFQAQIVALRFNGNNQDVYEKQVYVYQKNKPAFMLSYEISEPDLDLIKNTAVSHNFINSLSVDTEKNVITFVGQSVMSVNANGEGIFYSVQEAVMVPFVLRLLDTK